MKPFTRSKLFALAATMSVLAACAAPQAQPRAANPAAQAVTTAAASTDTPVAAPTLASAGKTLSIGLVEEPETLNPYITQLFTSYKVLWGVMDTLLHFDKEFKLGPGRSLAANPSAPARSC